ncbi:MAG: RIP metalloprotease RseP [Thermodesulfovibrionales bacterium]
MTFFWAIVLLGILIFVHELGHFLVAKLGGVKVQKFSLGFGPRVVGRTIGETEYRISAVPLGGYVKMLGEEPGEELPEAEKSRAFNYQPVWKRFLIVFAGPLFNVAFAAVLFVLIFLSGVPTLYPEVGEVMEGMPAASAGLMKGDRIVRVDGRDISEWSEMTEVIHGNPGKPLELDVEREGRSLSFTITPEKKAVTNIFGEETQVGLIGIKPSGRTFEKKFGPGEALVLGVQRTVDVSVLTVAAVVKLIQRIIPAKTIGGPIFIVQMAGEQAQEGAMNFFMFMAIISINLGIINLFPIPVLDGGHVLFLAIEAVRRKPLSERTIAVAQRLGLALILTLMAFAIYNDILRLFTGEGMP